LPDLAPLEVQALAKIMNELNYYQILHLEADATVSEIKKAFHQTSRAYHPDANRHREDAVRADCSRISKRVTEAYCVLRDPRRRRAYDGRLENDDGVRMQLAEAKAAHDKQHVEERQGKTPEGRQFYQKVVEDLKRGDEASAVRNLQMALTFESDNEAFKEQLQELRESIKQSKRK